MKPAKPDPAPVVNPEHPPVRSFVRRAGRLTSGQQRALQELWPLYGCPAGDGPLNLPVLFGRTAPVTLEIGIGNGDNLVAMAANAPDMDFLGIEVHEPGIGHCLLRIEQLQLRNVRLIREDAVMILRRRLGADTLSRVNLFFPDPWPKKRHHKRRIVQPGLLRDIARALLPGGIFHTATDWPEYAVHIDAVVAASGLFESLDTPPDDRITTRFDQRGKRLGHENQERAWRNRSKLPIKE